MSTTWVITASKLVRTVQHSSETPGGGGEVVWWCGGGGVAVWWCGGLWVGGLVGWWVGGLVGWWVGGLVGWWVGGLVVVRGGLVCVEEVGGGEGGGGGGADVQLV